jgi:ribosomal protein L11 methyltransferase
MLYYELSCQVSHEVSEAVVELLHRHGASGVTIEDSKWRTDPHPDHFGEIFDPDQLNLPEAGVLVKAYIAEADYNPDLPKVIQRDIVGLKEFGLDPGEVSITTRSIDEEVWANGWKQFYHPVRVTDRLMIIPSWEMEQTDVPAGVERIILDPGMAFGTGTHATTTLCMELLEDVIRGGETVFDVGCGTAILSIAAAKLGAKSVLALDLDSVAVEVAKDNVARNGVDSKVRVEQGNLLSGIDGTCDVIVANILADIVIQLTPDAFRHLAPGGTFITSGIIEKYADQVYKVLTDRGFTNIEKRSQGDWVAFLARKC